MTLRSLCQWPTHFLYNVTIVQKNYLSCPGSVLCGWLGDTIRMQIIQDGFIIFCTVFVFAWCPHISSEAQSVVGSLSAHYLVITHNLLQQTCYKDRQLVVFLPKLTRDWPFFSPFSQEDWIYGFTSMGMVHLCDFAWPWSTIHQMLLSELLQIITLLHIIL